VTPSKSAVPFWLAVAPTVRTKRLTCWGRRRFSSATRSAVGRVALLDAVEKAVTIAGCTPRKKRRGLIRSVISGCLRQEISRVKARIPGPARRSRTAGSGAC
jgi:hypothetical protein